MRAWWRNPNHPAWGVVLGAEFFIAYGLILFLLAVTEG